MALAAPAGAVEAVAVGWRRGLLSVREPAGALRARAEAEPALGVPRCWGNLSQPPQTGQGCRRVKRVIAGPWPCHVAPPPCRHHRLRPPQAPTPDPPPA